METLIIGFVTIGFTAVLTKYVMDAIAKVAAPFEGQDKKRAHKYYPAVNLAIAMFLAVGVHAAIASSFGIDWYYPAAWEWIVTGILASLGSKAIYDIKKELEDFRINKAVEVEITARDIESGIDN